MKENEKLSDIRFKELIQKAVDGTISDQEDEEIDQFFESKDSFHYFKIAADYGYPYAYYVLGKAFLYGEHTEQSYPQALHYLNIAIQKDKWGNAELGDCYRLGRGVEKNFELAWKYYNQAYLGDETLEEVTIRNLLLLDLHYLDDIGNGKIAPEWWEFAITKAETRNNFFEDSTQVADLFGEMTLLYEKDSPRYLYWVHKAADAGQPWCQKHLLDLAESDAEKEKYITAILDAPLDEKNDWFLEDVARTAIKGNFSEEVKNQALLVLFDNDFISLEEYKDKEFEDMLECALRHRDKDKEDNFDLPDDFVVCPCCKRAIHRDDFDNPDKQGEICNDCYYSGRFRKLYR